MMHAGKLLSGFIAIGLAVGLAGVAYAQSPSEWDQVIAAAKKEGRVVIYSGAPGAPEHREIGKLFEAKYGIRVDVLDGSGSEIQERIRTEVTAGRSNGDVSHIGGTTQVLLQNYGLLAPHGGVPNRNRLVIQPMVDEELPIYVAAYGIVVNTQMVKPEDEPKSWRDLLDAKWKGRILSYPFSASGGGATWFGVMQDTFGTGFHESLAKNTPVFSGSLRENPRRVARGEFPLYIPYSITDITRNEGLPLKVLIPEEGLPYTPFSVAIIKGAQHPNAARLLVNFFLEPEAQLVYARSGNGLATGGLEAQVPEARRWSVFAKLLGRQKLEGQEERQKLAAKIYEGK